MTDAIERIIRIHRTDQGHEVLTAIVTDAYGLMPVRVAVGGEHTIHMTWSEWGEVRDHVDACKPATWDAIDAAEPTDACPYRVDEDEATGDPGGPCVLQAGHEPRTRLTHFTRSGYSFGSNAPGVTKVAAPYDGPYKRCGAQWEGELCALAIGHLDAGAVEHVTAAGKRW